jgi:hypothetical protein
MQGSLFTLERSYNVMIGLAGGVSMTPGCEGRLHDGVTGCFDENDEHMEKDEQMETDEQMW